MVACRRKVHGSFIHTQQLILYRGGLFVWKDRRVKFPESVPGFLCNPARNYVIISKIIDDDCHWSIMSAGLAGLLPEKGADAVNQAAVHIN
ncbi:hypothetical protein AS034_21800 [[Bacillus] enclensis]|nr:hypothetical protein AS034_21800 [[Bacillus] enclensis]